MTAERIHPLLDKGYVRLVDNLGTDLSIVNAARVSYDKESDEFDEKDERLIRFLFEHGHNSPLRHAVVTFEVYAPLMVARQWWKYAVASSHVEDQNGWNESSRRYITESEEFYVPEQWRMRPDNLKQGSSGPVGAELAKDLTRNLNGLIDVCESLYGFALSNGVAPEQARLFLPAYGMYVRWRWTASVEAVLHFLNQRLGKDAQYEISVYAEAVESLIKETYPHVYTAWKEYNAK